MQPNVSGKGEAVPVAPPCEKCGRPIQVDRDSCIYCGAALVREGSGGKIGFDLTPAEEWELGHHVVLTQGSASLDIGQTSNLLNVPPDVLAAALHGRFPVPFARITRRSDADKLAARLVGSGCGSTIVDDRDLRLEAPNVRLGSLGVRAGRFYVKDFNRGAEQAFPLHGPALVVEGFLETVETTAPRPPRGSEPDTHREAVSSSDVSVLDIYFGQSVVGFRIVPNGFNFDFLGGSKDILAARNWPRLKNYVCENLPRVIWAEGYSSLRPLLDLIWPRQVTRTSRPASVPSYRGRKTEVVRSSGNLKQFDRYSRLLSFLR